MVEEIRNHVRKREGFAFETALSGGRNKTMSNRTTNCGKDRKQRDPDLAAAEIAMKRAAAKARENARRIGSGIVVWKDGRIVEER